MEEYSIIFHCLEQGQVLYGSNGKREGSDLS